MYHKLKFHFDENQIIYYQFILRNMFFFSIFHPKNVTLFLVLLLCIFICEFKIIFMYYYYLFVTLYT